MGTEVATLYASLEANITPLDSALAEADTALKGVAEQAAITTDVVAGLGEGAAVAAEGLTGVAATGAMVSESSLAAAAALSVETENFDLLAAATETANSAMSVLPGVGIAAAVALGVLKGGLDNTLGSAVDLGAEVHQLSLEIGSTADESSKLIYAASVTGVSVDTLNRGINIATRALQSNKSLGIEPTVEGLGKLSDMYLALEPGVERDAFLLHEFGRSGADLAPLMALGSAGIEALGNQAQVTGNVINDQAAGGLRNYSVSLNQLETDAKGAGVRVGVDLANALTPVIKGADDGVVAWGDLIGAMKDGSISADEYRTKLFQLETGQVSGKQIIDEYGASVQRVNDYLAQGGDDSDRIALGKQQIAAAQATANTTYSDAASIIAGYTDNVNLQADSQWKAQQATDAYNTALHEQVSQTELAAGMAGAVAKAQEAYGATVEADAPKLAKLRAELSNLEAAQGSNIIVTTKGQYSAEQLAVAQERLTIAEERLAEGHYKTQAAQDAAELSVRTAQDTVDKMAAHQATATSTTADYTTQIGKLKEQIDPLVAAEDKARDAIDKATSSLLYQALAADKNLSGDQLTKIAHGLGLISDADYNLSVAAEKARQTYDDEIKSGVSADVAMDHLNSTLAALKYNSENASAATDPLADHVADVGTQADTSATKMGNLNEQIAALHDKTVNIDVITNEVTLDHGGHSAGRGTGAAVGGEFVIPAGYNENYRVGPYVASSGETVTITPQGGRSAGGGGNTYVTINDKLAAALYMEQMRQTKIARHEAVM